MTDAEATIRFAIQDAIAETAHITGLRAGKASETLADSIFRSVMDPAIRWALREVGDEARPSDAEGAE